MISGMPSLYPQVKFGGWNNLEAVTKELDKKLTEVGLGQTNSMGVPDGKGPLLTITFQSPQERQQIMTLLEGLNGWSNKPQREKMIFDLIEPVGKLRGVEIALFDFEQAERLDDERNKK